ncbi:ornithine cyclodeaminase/alanine dehydrogenase [Rhizobium mesoamericanum]|uniref:ornithine cyclodeaminase family protein n=1 Tax=Rhizobium mesoamericanum TaxID=1079800 RepID=UPI0027813BB2|nr:ornithine cyclodeaminase family protein [Rhizobium mesoamericanum]MDQ0562944.1 ornithine cyclodeaminase/alanine dehydrogenase [Rhizobium mesoamericanum]
MSDDILYLNAADIDRLDMKPSDLRSTLRNAFSGYGSSNLRIPPKQTIRVSPDRYFQTMAAVSSEPPFAAVKWVSVVGANSQRGLPNINGLIIVGDSETGRPLAIMDGSRVTIMRTAAMSALASEYVANSSSTALGFVGCGAQAYGHLPALRDVLPSLQNIVCFDRRTESAAGLARHAAAEGIFGRATENLDDVLQCDVIVSTVPSVAGMHPFLDARKLKPGSLAIAVDMGRSWLPESLTAFDRYVVDDRAQAEDPENRSKLAYPGPFDADLADLTGGAAKGRNNASDRVLFIYPGFALADLAIAGKIYINAVQANVGAKMPR